MRPFLVALAASALFGLAAPAADLRYFDDASLHAVHFVDANEGWAAGDEGVVWHTIDGGQNWERQPTGVRASLRSVHFLNPYIGWIAGREERPHGEGSAGVLLFTRDGGMKWQRSANNDLPGLNRVRFVDARTGFAVGDGTEQFPAGIFRTADAGRSWHAVAGPRCTSWLAADFQDDQTGALAGAWSRLGVLRQGKFARADWEDTPGGRAIQDLQVVGKRAVAVGQGGLVLTSSSSAGGQWGYANLTLPTEVRACWDFHGVHWVGDQIWIVGRPGSVVLHSPDQGQSWEVSKTGQPLPLHGVFFASDKAGWAVGDFGTILNTADGGKNWRAQHRGGQRAAILFAAARPTALPVDALAKLGGDEGFLAAALRVTSADAASADPARASQAMRFAAAVRAAGGAAGETLWQFALPQHLVRADSKELIRAWNPLFADRAADEVLRQLVLAVRIWRPDVVVTDSPDATGGSGPCETLVVEALHKAFQLAADPKAFPEQIQFLHLEPWEVKKSYARWDSASNAQVQIDLTQVSDRLEASIRDFAAPALGLLADAPLALPTMRFFHLLDSRLASADKYLDLMRGIEPSPTGVSRRAQPPVSPLSQDVEKSIRSRRNLESLVAMPANQLTDPNRMLAQIAPMLGGMHEDQAAPAAFAVANHYVRIGQWTMAREIFLHMVDHYPAHPLSADAYRWLIRHNTSGEARRRQEMGQFWVLSQTTVRPSEDYRSESIVKFREFDEIVKDQLTMLGDRTETRRWYQGSLDIGKRFAALGPLYATEPPIQFCLQAARRHLGDFDAARAWYQQFCTEHPDGPWRDAAAMELWLLNRTGMPPKPVAYCREASARPFLDGKLDDACWQGVKPLVLRNAVGDTVKDHPSEAWLAYDKDFLYVALRCRHPAERYVPPVAVRPRDADLRPFDHVSLLLDLDRDYATYFRLEVDQRGCVCDDCWEDRTWNPRWFVALHSERDCWQVELAIPMIELTGEAVTFGRSWACNIVRTLPGRGVQAWSLPAEVQPRPEGMGLLMFLKDTDSKAAAGPGQKAATRVP